MPLSGTAKGYKWLEGASDLAKKIIFSKTVSIYPKAVSTTSLMDLKFKKMQVKLKLNPFLTQRDTFIHYFQSSFR